MPTCGRMRLAGLLYKIWNNMMYDMVLGTWIDSIGFFLFNISYKHTGCNYISSPWMSYRWTFRLRACNDSNYYIKKKNQGLWITTGINYIQIWTSFANSNSCWRLLARVWLNIICISTIPDRLPILPLPQFNRLLLSVAADLVVSDQ